MKLTTMWFARKWHSPSRMHSTLMQTALQCTLLSLVVVPANHSPVKPRRSPLEIGLVSFDDAPRQDPKHHHSLVNKTVTVTKSTKSSVELPLHSHVVVPNHSHHVWIPGHVHHHAYIPAHAHHVLVSAHSLLLTRTVHAVLVPEPSKVADGENVYRSHIGGFGVGVDFGGAGAGHGFHVSF